MNETCNTIIRIPETEAKGVKKFKTVLSNPHPIPFELK